MDSGRRFLIRSYGLVDALGYDMNRPSGGSSGFQECLSSLEGRTWVELCPVRAGPVAFTWFRQSIGLPFLLTVAAER